MLYTVYGAIRSFSTVIFTITTLASRSVILQQLESPRLRLDRPLQHKQFDKQPPATALHTEIGTVSIPPAFSQTAPQIVSQLHLHFGISRQSMAERGTFSFRDFWTSI